MDILEKLDMLVNYYEKTRGVGHTTLMLEGTKSKSCLIMAHTHEYACDLMQQSGGSSAVSWSDLSFLGIGHHLPLAIDNSAMIRICHDAAHEIAKLQAEVRALVNKLIELTLEKNK